MCFCGSSLKLVRGRTVLWAGLVKAPKVTHSHQQHQMKSSEKRSESFWSLVKSETSADSSPAVPVCTKMCVCAHVCQSVRACVCVSQLPSWTVGRSTLKPPNTSAHTCCQWEIVAYVCMCHCAYCMCVCVCMHAVVGWTADLYPTVSRIAQANTWVQMFFLHTCTHAHTVPQRNQINTRFGGTLLGCWKRTWAVIDTELWLCEEVNRGNCLVS